MNSLRELMACPPSWYDTSGGDYVVTILELDWYYSLAQHAVDGNDLPFHPYEFDEYAGDDNSLEREHMVKNLAMRRKEVMKTFALRSGRLIGLRFMRPSEQGKHFNAGWSQQQVIAKSSSGTSYLFHDLECEELERSFWEFLHHTFMDHLQDPDDYVQFVTPKGALAHIPEAALWNRLLTHDSQRVCINTIRAVGATNGNPTSYLCFDINFSARLAHVYPVSEAEAKSIMGGCQVFRDDGINC